MVAAVAAVAGAVVASRAHGTCIAGYNIAVVADAGTNAAGDIVVDVDLSAARRSELVDELATERVGMKRVEPFLGSDCWDQLKPVECTPLACPIRRRRSLVLAAGREPQAEPERR